MKINGDSILLRRSRRTSPVDDILVHEGRQALQDFRLIGVQIALFADIG